MALGSGSPDQDSVVQFAHDLRIRRGELSYRALSRATEFSAATIHSATAGFKLPTLKVTLSYVAACPPRPDHDRATERQYWTRRWGGLDNQARESQHPPRPAPLWLNDDITSSAELLATLARLKDWSGLSYRTLSAHTQIPHSSLWGMLTGIAPLTLSRDQLHSLVHACLNIGLAPADSDHRAAQFAHAHLRHAAHLAHHDQPRTRETPNPAIASTITGFLDQMQALRAHLGTPALETLERRGGPPRSTVYRVFSGRQDLGEMRKPTEFITRYIRALQHDPQPWVEHFERLQANRARTPLPAPEQHDLGRPPSDPSPDWSAPPSNPDSIHTRIELGRALHRLLDEARLTVAQSAERSHVSSSKISAWINGRSLPRDSDAMRSWLAVVGVHNIDAWMNAARRVTDHRRHLGPAPYPGLSAFNEGHADVFFGRDDLVHDLVSRVRDAIAGTGPRVIFVIGSSGVGKTSLILAGLVPHLASTDIETMVLNPDITTPAALLMASEHATSNPTAVIIDQAEQLWALPESVAATTSRDRIAEWNAPNSAMVVVLRADKYDRIVGFPGFFEFLEAGNVVAVHPMTPRELTEAIVQPARYVGVTVEQPLIEAIIRDARGAADGPDKPISPGTLPLLQHALEQTYHARTEQQSLTLADYHHVGTLVGLVSKKATAALEGFDLTEQNIATTILLRCADFTDGRAPTRRTVARDQLIWNDTGPGTATVDMVIERLIATRILTETVSGLEIAHDSILTHWTPFQTWIASTGEHLKTHQKLAELTAEWFNRGTTDDWLLSRGMTRQFIEAVNRSHLPLTRSEHRFLICRWSLFRNRGPGF